MFQMNRASLINQAINVQVKMRETMKTAFWLHRLLFLVKTTPRLLAAAGDLSTCWRGSLIPFSSVQVDADDHLMQLFRVIWFCAGCLHACEETGLLPCMFLKIL